MKVMDFPVKRIHEIAGTVIEFVSTLEDDPMVVASSLESAAAMLRGAQSALVSNALNARLLR